MRCPRCDNAELDAAPPRAWVVRLGAYLRIFGPPAPGTFGYRTADSHLDSLIETAKERESEFGASGSSRTRGAGAS